MNGPMETPRWQSYNCFSSSVGSILAHHDLPYVAAVVDAGIDFFYRPAETITMASAGVWPGAVHPRIAWTLHRLFGLALTFTERDDGAVLAADLATAMAARAPMIVAVANTACRHVPRRELLERITHYLIVEGVEGGAVKIHDGFVGHRGAISLDELDAAAVFIAFDGDAVRRRTCAVGPPDALEAAREQPPSPREAVRAALLAPPIEALAGDRGDAIHGPSGIRALANDVMRLAPEALAGGLGALFQALRYVQYQRAHLLRWISEAAAIDAAARAELNLAARHAEPLADAWFRAKTLAQIGAVKSRSSCLLALSLQLRELAVREEAVLDILDRARAIAARGAFLGP